jgi:hypothetical protein
MTLYYHNLDGFLQCACGVLVRAVAIHFHDDFEVHACMAFCLSRTECVRTSSLRRTGSCMYRVCMHGTRKTGLWIRGWCLFIGVCVRIVAAQNVACMHDGGTW